MMLVPFRTSCVMRPLRGERTISVAKGRLEEVEGAERGFNPLYTAFQSMGRPAPPLPLVAKQWRLKPLFLVELTLASVLRESFEIITRLDLGVIFPQGLLLRKAAVSAIIILVSPIAFQQCSKLSLPQLLCMCFELRQKRGNVKMLSPQELKASLLASSAIH
jgi:hypothetical protein